MEIVPYHIHSHVAWMVDEYNLNVFNMERYIYDDVYVNQKYLRTLDPKDWKDQDHYAVLRLSKVRFHASQELIRQAYRKQLLDHHPDKGKQRLVKCSDESTDYFTNITRAYELLKDQTSRNSYDSVDPEFDDSVPSIRDAKERFFESFGPVFQRNSRWSKIQPVPLLGNENSPIEEVHQFYEFWNDFRSWREFSYLDEEEKNPGDCRDERRYIDKLNKAERKRKSQEECKRINYLIDLAKQNDQRIIRHNEKRKAERDAEKKSKINKKLEVKLAAEKIVREEKERLQREEKERQQKIKDEIAQAKNQKEMLKNKQKKEKRKLRKMAEENDFFVDLLSKGNGSKSMEMKKAEMQFIIDGLCLKMSLVDITALNEDLEFAAESQIVGLIKKGEEMVNGGKYSEILVKCDDATIPEEIIENVNRCGSLEWNDQLVEFLIKSMENHQMGSKNRWQLIAQRFNDAYNGINVVEQQVIQKARMLRISDGKTTESTNSQKESNTIHHVITIEEHKGVQSEEKTV